MRVKLLQMTKDPINIMWTAARTCYSSKSPIELWDDIYDQAYYKNNDAEISVNIDCISPNKVKDEEKRWNLVKTVLDSGHQSIAEHVYFTFGIEGISRACSHQLVRHRLCVYSQQSQRYVEIKEDLNALRQLYNSEMLSDSNQAEKLDYIINKYFVIDNDKIDSMRYLNSLISYLTAILDGCKPEEARQLLPNATKTNIVMSGNFRQLIHICNLRLCTRSQKEIRQLFSEIVKLVKQQDERLSTYLIPTCEVNGFCTEKNCCGRKKALKDLQFTN